MALAAVVVAALTSSTADTSRLDFGSDATVGGVLQAAGLLFFAFAGYARIATLGEEVRAPARTIPRAIPIVLGITLVVYTLVAVSALMLLGPDGPAEARAPLSDAARAAGADWLVPVVRVGAVIAALGSLLALILGVSRTTLAMARDRHLSHALAAVHPKFQVPHRAELLVGVVVAVAAATGDLRGRSASPPSVSCSPTPSPTPPPGPSPRTRAARTASSPLSDWSAASSWPSPRPSPQPSPGPR